MCRAPVTPPVSALNGATPASALRMFVDRFASSGSSAITAAPMAAAPHGMLSRRSFYSRMLSHAAIRFARTSSIFSISPSRVSLMRLILVMTSFNASWQRPWRVFAPQPWYWRKTLPRTFHFPPEPRCRAWSTRTRCRRLDMLPSCRIHPCSCGLRGAVNTRCTVNRSDSTLHRPGGDQATKRSHDRGWDDLPFGIFFWHDSDKQSWC